jgi:hypothetical protein
MSLREEVSWADGWEASVAAMTSLKREKLLPTGKI